MNGKREYYYKILGLKPGATPDEIKSAYRRLVKFYHPDRDNSPDSQSMYKEINIAYKALHNQATAGETDINSVINRNYSKKTAQASGYKYKKAQQSNANSSKETKQNSSYGYERAQQSNANNSGNYNQQSEGMSEELKKHYEGKISFELQNLALIFRHSLRELLTINNYEPLLLKVFISSCLMIIGPISSVGRIPEPINRVGSLMALFFITSLVLFIYIRYYFQPSKWSILARFIAANTYGAILSLIIVFFYPFLGGLTEKVAKSIWFFGFFTVLILTLPNYIVDAIFGKAKRK